MIASFGVVFFSVDFKKQVTYTDYECNNDFEWAYIVAILMPTTNALIAFILLLNIRTHFRRPLEFNYVFSLSSSQTKPSSTSIKRVKFLTFPGKFKKCLIVMMDLIHIGTSIYLSIVKNKD